MSCTKMSVFIIIYYPFSVVRRRALYFFIKKEIGVIYNRSHLLWLQLHSSFSHFTDLKYN
jgi:hypothetical protein